MDSTSITILRSVTTIQAFIAVSSSLLVIYMAVYKSPKCFMNFATLVIVNSAVQTVSCTFGWTTVNQVAGVTSDGTIVFVIYGISSYIGPRFAFAVDQFTFPLGMIHLYLTPFCMGYRLYVVNYDSLKRKYLLSAVFIISSPFIAILIVKLTLFCSAEEIYQQLPGFEAKYSKFVIFGLRRNAFVSPAVNYLNYSPFICCFFTVALRQLIIWSIRRVSRQFLTMSKELHKETVWMLTIQATVPLFTAAGGLITNYSFGNNTEIPLLNSLTYVILVMRPILESITVLLCIPHYRATLKRWLCGQESQLQPIVSLNANSDNNTFSRSSIPRVES